MTHPAGASAVPASDAGAVPATGGESAVSAPASRGMSFARGLWRIASASVSGGNRVELLRDGPCAFDAMLAAIGTARETVSLEAYLVSSDTVGNRFADALIDAARRGVKARMIADWVGARGTTRAYWRRMRQAGVEVRIFNPPGIRPWLGLVPRDHRKLLAVDDRVGVTGGVGLSEEWSGIMRHRRTAPWRDTSVQIVGPAVAEMSAAFDDMWRRAGGEERRARRRLRRGLVRAARGTDVDPETTQGAVVGIIEGEPWRLRVARAMQIQSVAAERLIWIASAYFYPSVAELEALAGAARDGVDVRILVPSKYDHPWVRRLTHRVYQRLLRNHVRIWEWNGEMMHAKTSVVDGHWVRVGSTDFNPLGVAINYELDAIIEDATIGEQAMEMYLSDLEGSTEIRRPRRRSRIALSDHPPLPAPSPDASSPEAASPDASSLNPAS